MDDRFNNIIGSNEIYPTPIEREKQKRDKLFRRMLVESYGSFEGQYDLVNDVTEKIIKLLSNGDCQINENLKHVNFIEKEDSHIGVVEYDIYWYFKERNSEEVKGKRTVGADGHQIVELTINYDGIHLSELSSTIAHEIMHCFQTYLPKVNGVNDGSMHL